MRQVKLPYSRLMRYQKHSTYTMARAHTQQTCIWKTSCQGLGGFAGAAKEPTDPSGRLADPSRSSTSGFLTCIGLRTAQQGYCACGNGPCQDGEWKRRQEHESHEVGVGSAEGSGGRIGGQVPQVRGNLSRAEMQ